MDIHIDWDYVQRGLQLFTQFPVLIVLFGGMFLGAGFAQMIKLAYLAYSDGKVTISPARYNFSVRLLSMLTTYACTVKLWHTFLPHDGLEELVGLGWGASTPIGYAVAKKLARKFFGDDFVAGWGDKEEK